MPAFVNVGEYNYLESHTENGCLAMSLGTHTQMYGAAYFTERKLKMHGSDRGT